MIWVSPCNSTNNFPSDKKKLLLWEVLSYKHPRFNFTLKLPVSFQNKRLRYEIWSSNRLLNVNSREIPNNRAGQMEEHCTPVQERSPRLKTWNKPDVSLPAANRYSRSFLHGGIDRWWRANRPLSISCLAIAKRDATANQSSVSRGLKETPDRFYRAVLDRAKKMTRT